MNTSPAEPVAKINRKDRRRLETRARLLDATLRLLLEKGVDGTTMDAITEYADLGRRTLYYHFDSKEECVLAAVAKVFEKHANRAEHTISKKVDPAVLVAAHARLALGGLSNEPVISALVPHPHLLANALDQATTSFALQDFQVGLDSGHFSLDLEQDLLKNVLVWVLVGLLIEYDRKHISRDDLMSTYPSLVLMHLGLTREEAKKANRRAARLLTRQNSQSKETATSGN